MHYAHVKRKENLMKPVTMKAIRIHPEMLAVIEARARRARAEAVHSLIVRLIERLTPRAGGQPFGIRWG